MKIFRFFSVIVLVAYFTGMAFTQTSPDVKFNLKLGGVYLMPKVEYDYGWSRRYSGETMSLSSSLVSANLLGGSFGAGIVFKQHFEIYTNYSFFKKTLVGDISFTLPSYRYWYEIATAEAEVDLEHKESIIEVGVAYHLLLENVSPYFGVGVSRVSAEIETPTALIFTDRHEGTWYYYWWWGWYFDFDEHVVDIDSVDITEKSVGITGFHFKAGIDFSVTPNIEFFLEGKYIAAKTDLPIKIDARSSGKRYLGDRDYRDTREFLANVAEEFEIDLGGLSAVFGLKIVF